MQAESDSSKRRRAPDAARPGEGAASRRAGPRYMHLAQTLLQEIEAGIHPVGTQLPTEYQLCDRFAVSRATAREAVKHLVAIGLVTRQARVGSIVRARSASESYRQSAADLRDLAQYAKDTTLVIEACELRPLDADFAAMVEARAGGTWLHLQGRRFAPSRPEPICTTELWLHPDFRTIRGIMGPLPMAVHAAVEQQFGEVIFSVEQEIRAVLLGKAQAVALQVPPRSPALWIVRRYRNRKGVLLELAISVHPADRFRYSTVLRQG